MSSGPERPEPLETKLRVALSRALAAVGAGHAVESALRSAPPPSGRALIVAAGKAAVAMTSGAFAAWGVQADEPASPDTHAAIEALVVTTDGGPSAPVPAITLRASHPIPDLRSLIAAERALELAAGLGRGDTLLALVSGGASSLLCAPTMGMTLDRKREVVRRLLEAGAPIAEVNLVRRHLSRIKGGRLAEAALPADVVTLVVSDVIDGALHDVGSGPTVTDPTTVEAARAVLARWIPDLAPELDRFVLSSPTLPNAAARILLEPNDLATNMTRELTNAGFIARALPAEQGELAEIAERRIRQAQSLAPGEAIAIACEPTLRLPATHGKGGRAGRCALLALPNLRPGVALLCAASDGVDGSSGTGGALITKSHAARIDPAAIAAALARYDDAEIHERLGTALPGTPTGNNLTDIHVLARAR